MGTSLDDYLAQSRAADTAGDAAFRALVAADLGNRLRGRAGRWRHYWRYRLYWAVHRRV